MAPLTLPLSERTRKYGYVYWKKALDDDVLRLLADFDTVHVILDGLYIGEKKLDFKNRRFSIGPGKSKLIPSDATVLKLSLLKNGKLNIRCQ